MFINNLGKGFNCREIIGKFGVSASAACEEVNTSNTDENLFRLVPMPGHGAQVLPLELVPGHVLRHGVRVLPLELVPGHVLRHGAQVLPLELVPGDGAQIRARAPTKGYVQTGTRAWAPCSGSKSEQGLRIIPDLTFCFEGKNGNGKGVFLLPISPRAPTAFSLQSPLSTSIQRRLKTSQGNKIIIIIKKTEAVILT